MKKQKQMKMKYAIKYGEFSNTGAGDSETVAKFSNLKEARKAFTRFKEYYKPCLKGHNGYTELTLERIPTEKNDWDLIIDGIDFIANKVEQERKKKER